MSACEKCWRVPRDIDRECRWLCRALNALPGITTTLSCCGHGRDPYYIWFKVTNFKARGLLVLSRFLCRRYHEFGDDWRIVIYHGDVKPQLQFLLEGPPGDYRRARRLARLIARHITNRPALPYYNILTNRVQSKGGMDYWRRRRRRLQGCHTGWTTSVPQLPPARRPQVEKKGNT